MDTQVIILAAGMGSRLRPYTDSVPKPLVKVNNIPIIHNTINNLIKKNLKEITIVGGYKFEKIRGHLDCHFSEIKFNYIFNDLFFDTNNMYSLYLALKELTDKSVLIIEGDVFFDGEILDALSEKNKENNYWFVDASYKEANGSYIRSHNRKIEKISIIKNTEEIKEFEEYSKSIGLVYLSNSNVKKVKSTLEEFVDKGETSIYYDIVFAEIIHELNMSIINTEGKKWYEIDDQEDLKKAELVFG